MKHFELTNETKENGLGITLHRIRCTVAIEKLGIEVGELGGWVEKEDNLSGDAWVSENARVFGNAEVSGNALVYGDAEVSGNARVSWDARVSGDAWVSENARVFGNAEVSGNALVSGDARVSENARVFGNAWVSGDAEVFGNAWVSGDAELKTKRDICWFSVFGSRNSTTTAYKTKAGVEITCGCFRGTIDDFEKKIKETHKGTEYEAEYLAICNVIRIRFNLNK